MKLPEFDSYNECRLFVEKAWSNPHLRPGQALCNKYAVPKQLDAQIWEERDLRKVVDKVWNYQQRNHHGNAN